MDELILEGRRGLPLLLEVAAVGALLMLFMAAAILA